MIRTKDQEQLLLQLGNLLERPCTCYAIGGTAMMYYGLKDVTLDVDLVFLNERERDTLSKGLRELGYRQMDACTVYGDRKNKPLMLTRGDERFDLFLNDIISFTFSKPMARRATLRHEYGKLTVHVTEPEDIILLKCATDRVKDQEDAIRIINGHDINYDVLISEAAEQRRLGHSQAMFELGCFLEELSEAGVTIPSGVLDTLYGLVEEQLKRKRTKK